MRCGSSHGAMCAKTEEDHGAHDEGGRGSRRSVGQDCLARGQPAPEHQRRSAIPRGARDTGSRVDSQRSCSLVAYRTYGTDRLLSRGPRHRRPRTWHSHLSSRRSGWAYESRSNRRAVEPTESVRPSARGGGAVRRRGPSRTATTDASSTSFRCQPPRHLPLHRLATRSPTGTPRWTPSTMTTSVRRGLSHDTSNGPARQGRAPGPRRLPAGQLPCRADTLLPEAPVLRPSSPTLEDNTAHLADRAAGKRLAAIAFEKHPGLARWCARMTSSRSARFPAARTLAGDPGTHALSGYGNIDDGRFSTSLTTIDLDIPEIARRTVELISQRIAGSDDGPSRTLIPTTLLRAESTLGATRTENWENR